MGVAGATWWMVLKGGTGDRDQCTEIVHATGCLNRHREYRRSWICFWQRYQNVGGLVYAASRSHQDIAAGDAIAARESASYAGGFRRKDRQHQNREAGPVQEAFARSPAFI